MSQTSEHPILIAKSDAMQGQRWTVDRELLIGRDADCEVIVPDRQVSRHHARITPTKNGAVLEDLESKNGTFCNERPVLQAVQLHDGDLIQIAMLYSFVFLVSEATVPMDASLLANLLNQRKLKMDVPSRKVWVNGEEILPPLSAQQFHLLQALFERPGEVLPREELIQLTWGEKEAIGVSEQAFDALIRRLRERLAQFDAEHEYIVTVRGHGLRLDIPKEMP